MFCLFSWLGGVSIFIFINSISLFFLGVIRSADYCQSLRASIRKGRKKVSDSQCGFGKAIAWMRAWVSGCAGVCLLPMFLYYCKSHVVSSIRGPLTPPAHQPLLLALGRPLLSTTWNHERSMSFLVSFRSCLTAVLSHLKSQPRRFSAMTPVTKFISDMLETQMNTSAANLFQLRVR